MRNTLVTQFQKNVQLTESRLNKFFDSMSNIDSLNLPECKAKEAQEFYEELGCPFFDSASRKQITKLAKLQVDAWNLHMLYKLLLILKSQKIGISSLCILITLHHALTDSMGMQLIINAQSDEQAKAHARDFRRIILDSKYRDYLITKPMPEIGLLKDEVTKVHTIYLHNTKDPKVPTEIIVTGMSTGSLLSHKRVNFIWSSDMTISALTAERTEAVWASMLSRRANSEGPVIIECPARNPDGPVYNAFEKYEKMLADKKTPDPIYDFHVEKFTYELGIRDGFFTQEFIESEKRKYGPLFGTFYMADFFASGHTWYKENMFKNITDNATSIFLTFNTEDAIDSDVMED